MNESVFCDIVLHKLIRIIKLKKCVGTARRARKHIAKLLQTDFSCLVVCVGRHAGFSGSAAVAAQSSNSSFSSFSYSKHVLLLKRSLMMWLQYIFI